jgi:hypothetical protein
MHFQLVNVCELDRTKADAIAVVSERAGSSVLEIEGQGGFEWYLNDKQSIMDAPVS